MVAAKTVSVSLDDTTYNVLPGNGGEFSYDLGVLDDTIFGQSYKSEQSGLAGWTVKGQAFWKGIAGYVATLNLTGTPTLMTAEPCALVTGKTYKVTSGVKQVIDPNTAVVVLDNAVDHTADVLNIDYLFGKITFKSAYTPTGPITITAKYLPLSAVANANSFTLGMTADAVDISDFATVQGNSGHRVFNPGLQTVSLELKGFYALANAWRTKIAARTLMVIDISPDGGGKTIMRGFYLPQSSAQSGNVGATEMETIKLGLFVPVPVSGLLLTPFNVIHTATTLGTAVQQVLTNFLAGIPIYVKYLEDGAAGKKGSAIITDCTLSGGVDAMNSFSINLQGSGTLTTI